MSQQRTRIVDKSKIDKTQATELEDFKRPDHPDFKDASELKAMEFTGYRYNSVSLECEIWLLGELKKSIGSYELDKNPNAVSDAMADVFALHKVLPNTPEGRMLGAEQDARDNGAIILPANYKG